MNEIIAGVDIGGTKVLVTLASRNGPLIRLFDSTRLTGDENSLPEQIKEMIGRGLDDVHHNIDDISRIGVSSAGPFKKQNGMIELVCHNICGGLGSGIMDVPNVWTSVPIESGLREIIPDPMILNDAVAGSVAERMFGAGIDRDDLLYVTWSTGIGTGAFVDGRLIKGKNGNAPHGGHVYVGEGGPICGCGNESDLEGSSSGSAIARGYGKGASTMDVFRAYHEGDEEAIKVIDDAARYFGRGLASINSVLDTGLIIIGGSVFLNNTELLLPKIEEEFYRSFPALSEGVRIVPSSLGEYLPDIAPLSLVIPDEWIKEWRADRPWESSPDIIRLDGE